MVPSVILGFVLLVFWLCLLVLRSHVAVLFSFALVCPLSHSRLTMPVGLCCVSFAFMKNCFMLSLSMHPIVTPQETSFLIRFPLGSTQQSPLSYAAISTRFLIVHLTVLGTYSLIPPESTTILSRLFDKCCVIDMKWYLHPSSSGYTWMPPDGSVFSRIDLIDCPYVWVPSILSFEIVQCLFSDHCAVLFCVTVPDVVPLGHGLWKLNTSVMEELGITSAKLKIFGPAGVTRRSISLP